jgi:hypothetical protein
MSDDTALKPQILQRYVSRRGPRLTNATQRHGTPFCRACHQRVFTIKLRHRKRARYFTTAQTTLLSLMATQTQD